MEKQSALEWFIREVYGDMWTQDEDIEKLVHKAREIEANQRQEDTNHGYSQGYDDGTQKKEPMKPSIKSK